MKISTILDHIDSGHMALPEFQRGYVWNRDQVRSLFDSLYRRHPVGGLLVWATESRSATHRGDGPVAAGIVFSQHRSAVLRLARRSAPRHRPQPPGAGVARPPARRMDVSPQEPCKSATAWIICIDDPATPHR